MTDPAEILRALGQRAPVKPGAARQAARDLVRRGVPATAVDRLAKVFGTNIDEIQRLIGLSRATGTRRRTERAPLRPLPSDRAFRLAGVFALAEHAFEDAAKARGWFKEPNRELDGERPISLLDTEAGTQEVVRVLKRIEFGIYS